MAILDALFEFSDAQAITVDAQSTNVLDWGSGMEGLEMGAGSPMYLNIRVATTFAGGTSLIVSLYSHSAATSIESGTAVFTTDSILQATLVAGYWITRIALPVNVDLARYLGVYYDQTGDFTAGAIDAWIDQGPQSSYDTQVAASNI
jgi:hypothetical protein